MSAKLNVDSFLVIAVLGEATGAGAGEATGELRAVGATGEATGADACATVGSEAPKRWEEKDVDKKDINKSPSE
ncbi:MAG: hypothetical protein ACK5T0_06220 [Vampirovibrionales bacterium]